MATTSDRRGQWDRRWRLEPAELLQRKGSDRRLEDRRSSARAVRRVTVVEKPDGLRREVRADLSLEGAQFMYDAALISSDVEVRFRLPDLDQEVSVPAHVRRARIVGKRTSVHVRFEDVDVRTELALARFLDFEGRLNDSKRT